jgi:uncharacterized membrane protein YjjP (DUF1212 family)
MPDDQPAKPANTAPTKPGWKTSEFWLSFGSMALSAAYASGLIGGGGTAAKVAAFAGMVLTGLGYTVSRGMAKNTAQPPAQ